MVFILHNVPSSKNSKIATSRGVFHSKTVSKYLQKLGISSYSSSKKYVNGYKTRKMEFPIHEIRRLFKDVTWPCIVRLHFVRDSKRQFDFNNASQIIFDLLTAFDVIPDDNMDYAIPECMWMNGSAYSINKEKPGVYISVKQKPDSIVLYDGE